MKSIKLNKKNVESIDCNEVAFYSYAETGAMGVHAGIVIITFDNKKYEGTYAFESLNISNFYRALPFLNKKVKGQKDYFDFINLGMGNYLYVRKEISEDFIKLVEKEIPEYGKKPGNLYAGWIGLADKYLNDLKKPQLKKIELPKEDRLNPFYCMGFSIDINDRKTQEKLINYLEKNSNHTLNGYSYQCLNAYSDKETNDGIQLSGKRGNGEMTLTEKIDDLVIHHTNNCVWRSDIEKLLANDDEFIIRPHVKDEHGAAIIKYVNADTKAYIEEGTDVIAQINCFAYDLKIFKGEEKEKLGENNFHFYVDDKKDPIYLSDNNILLAAIFSKDPVYSKLNMVKGDVLSIGRYKSTLLGEEKDYITMVVDTEFGPTPITCSESVISYINGDQIDVGDKIEAICSITGDLMLYYERTKTVRDRFNYFDILKKAFERKDMSYLLGIISDDCEYHSDRNNLVGKNQVVEKLQYITDVGYKDKEVRMNYCLIASNPVKHFPLGEEVLCLSCEEDGSVEGEFNFHMNKDKLIDKIYLTNDPKIRFKIYGEDGSIGIDDDEKGPFRELIKLMRQKGMTESDVHAILTFSCDDVDIIKELIEFIKTKRKGNKKIMSDMLGYEHKLTEKYKAKHPHREDIRVNHMAMGSKSEYYPKFSGKKTKSWRTLHYDNSGRSEGLDVVCNSSDAGQMRVKIGYKPNLVSCDLELCYGDLKELENNCRNAIKEIDLYTEGEDYDFSFNEAVEELNEEIKDYKYIRIWTKHNSINEYLLPYYFINKFYNKIKNKEIRIVFMDELKDRERLDELLDGEFEKLMKTEKILSKDEIKEYSDEWNKIKSKKSDIRDLKDGKIVFNKFEDYYEPILKLLSKHKEISRSKFFGDILSEKLINGADLIVFNHIIDLMIEKKLINSKDYKVPQFLPADKISVAKKESK